MTAVRGAAIWTYIVLVAFGAAAVHVFAVARVDASRTDWTALAPVLVAGGFLAAELLVVHLRLGREAYAFSLMEIPLVLGLFFVRPDLLVACRLAGTALAFLWQRKSRQKALFNLSLFALETGVAVVIWNFVVSDAHLLGPRAWFATMLTVLVTGVLSSTLVSMVITIATGELPRSLSEVFSLGQLGDLANAGFALLAVFVLSTDWRASWLLVVVTSVLVLAYRSYHGAREWSDSLAQVNRFTEVVGREVELEKVVRTVMHEVQAAFQVGSVELRLAGVEGQVHDWVLSEDAFGRAPAAVVDELSGSATEGVVLAPRGSPPAHLAEAMGRLGLRDCLMVPMRSEGEIVGSLLVADMWGDVETFSGADLSQLQALGNHAAVAIENAVRAELIIRQAEDRERRAMYDELTGLANRRLFGVRLDEAMALGNVTVLLVGMDRFKEVNDTLGHEVGDRLLQQASGRLGTLSPDDAMVARFGGDEFAVLLPGADDTAARSYAERARAALARPFDLDGVSVAVDASVGVALGAAGVDAVNLIRRADIAMYAAKERRSGLETFRPELDRSDATRLGLLADLRAAVAAEEIDVCYQPKVDVPSGDLVGVEALARWQHRDLGAVPPDEFIPLAEHSTLIAALTLHVLRRALAMCEIWRGSKPGFRDFSVAVNVSPRSLLDPRFVDEVSHELARVSVPASALTLEITETSLMADPQRAMVALNRLRELGVRLSVDDLGTGYSSLAYLQRLPVDEVKIDRSFLDDLTDSSAEAVVGALVDLGHRLGRQVVAEGVEDGRSFETLRRLGCDTAQGFWLARPMPGDDVTRLLGSWIRPATPLLRRVP